MKIAFNVYSRKQRWKFFLLGFAVVIVGASLWYTDVVVRKIARDESVKVAMWADAVQKRASLVKYTEEFFEEIKKEEKNRVQIWASAYHKIFAAALDEDITFYSEIVLGNKTIPVILVDENENIITSANLDSKYSHFTKFDGKLKAFFSEYSPIPFTVEKNTEYIYYNDSRLFTELRDVLDDIIESFISEVVINSANVPVIITDSTKTKIIAHGNIEDMDISDPDFSKKLISRMTDKNPSIIINLPGHGTCYVYYTNSALLKQLRYYPPAQLFVIAIFLVISYLLFSTARNAEQNQVWVGMSKETAHQLGTPLSSLMAWVEILKMRNIDKETINEISKDIRRLENITERFSKIGSPPNLTELNIVEVIHEVVEYMKTRTSKKVKFKVYPELNTVINVKLNSNLFEWVIENIIKNAVDAMDGEGVLSILVQEHKTQVFVDITDTGKGIHKSKFKSIFQPGYTSKKRGWGLGLSLSKRIIENYHKGRLFVKSSGIKKGTTFRIVLRNS
ncbi:MAG: HAMP domain-containing histidine kinase [Bacteroidetes bacterium]|nr:HAMP domain-containing histidine kinase [Bacteroidota bacterium]